MTTCDRGVVAALCDAIVQRIGEPRYRLWFENHTKFRRDDDQLVVGVPNHFFQDWLQKTFADDIRAAAAEVFGQITAVRFVIDPELFQAARRAQEEQCVTAVVKVNAVTEKVAPEAKAEEPGSDGGRKLASKQPCLFSDAPPSNGTKERTRRWHHLRDFVVGACNRVAHASAQSVVEQPAQSSNPLVLHGPVGTGKTHLLEGIYAGLRRHSPQQRVCFVPAEEFTNRFIQAVRFGKLGAFRKYFRECDALLVDDLNFLAQKRATQEEFLHTFDALQADGKQVVVTCDCHPRLCDDFLPELADRLLAGGVWGLVPPDPATRLDILRQLAARGEPSIPEEVLRFVAGQLRGNVRELAGAVHSLRHFSKVVNQPIDVSLARQALGDLLRHALRVVQLPDIDRAVCQALRLATGALQSKQRGWAVSHPRMLAMHLARKHTAAAYSEIGHHFGGRNHSTVVAADKKVRAWIQQDGELLLGERRVSVRAVMEMVERELNG